MKKAKKEKGAEEDIMRGEIPTPEEAERAAGQFEESKPEEDEITEETSSPENVIKETSELLAQIKTEIDEAIKNKENLISTAVGKLEEIDSQLRAIEETQAELNMQIEESHSVIEAAGLTTEARANMEGQIQILENQVNELAKQRTLLGQAGEKIIADPQIRETYRAKLEKNKAAEELTHRIEQEFGEFFKTAMEKFLKCPEQELLEREILDKEWEEYGKKKSKLSDYITKIIGETKDLQYLIKKNPGEEGYIEKQERNLKYHLSWHQFTEKGKIKAILRKKEELISLAGEGSRLSKKENDILEGLWNYSRRIGILKGKELFHFMDTEIEPLKKQLQNIDPDLRLNYNQLGLSPFVHESFFRPEMFHGYLTLEEELENRYKDNPRIKNALKDGKIKWGNFHNIAKEIQSGMDYGHDWTQKEEARKNP